jgi:hypothetical protein
MVDEVSGTAEQDGRQGNPYRNTVAFGFTFHKR